MGNKRVTIKEYCGEDYPAYQRSLEKLEIWLLDLANEEGEFLIADIISFVGVYKPDDEFIKGKYIGVLSTMAEKYCKKGILLNSNQIGIVYYSWNKTSSTLLKSDGRIDLHFEFRRNLHWLKMQCQEYILNLQELSKISVVEVYESFTIEHKEDVQMASKYKRYILKVFLSLTEHGYFRMEYLPSKRKKVFIRTLKRFGINEHETEFDVAI